MSGLIETENTYFFSSSEQLGAINKDRNGSRFQIALQKPITVPPAAIDVSIECIAANIWHYSPNVSAEFNNNTFHFQYAGVDIPIVLPDGLYGADSLNKTVQRLLSAVDIPGSPGVKFAESSILIYGNVATQRIVIQMAGGLSLNVDTALPNNIAPLIGFTVGTVGTLVTSQYVGHYFEGDQLAEINRINAYLLHSDIVQDGISINSSFDSILAEIQLTARAGSLLTYRPYIPYKVSGKHLKFGPKDFLTFYLTDELNRPVDMFGENYSFTIVIKYKIYDHAANIPVNTPHVNLE